MAQIVQLKVKNRLLRILSREDFSSLAPHLEFAELPRRYALAEKNVAGRYCYFLESGLGSIVAVSPDGGKAEVGLFGRDGMTPASIALDAGSTPHEVFMQVPGNGYRIESAILAGALEASPVLRKLLTRYAQSLSIQASFTALSNAIHNVEERLARWLLMCHDRLEGDDIELTHEFLSIMLAVRRSSVTTALHVLEGNKFISSERGVITIGDRAALEMFAQDAYGPAELEYQRLVGSLC